MSSRSRAVADPAGGVPPRPGPEPATEPATERKPRPGAARRLAVPLAVLGAVAAAFAYVGAVDPDRPGHYPLCPLRYYTGLNCPACGGLRGAHALVHGQLRAGLRCNALAVAGYAAFAVVWTVWAVRSARGLPYAPVLRPGARRALVVVAVVFTVVRNLPFGRALSP
ncbi:DUF2752 domain-containing protein [Actinacidiphila yeochonensis]|uniref:DUF2752 domain-containing protein n=1 Tax=Actinacidiphila yeochonensis TaxID=89050 RepID=UPI00099E129F|nr:DUF2752 domain-containing protein [Actinacidiphila yeochonensis]